jgi:hypothetical protein
VIDMMFEKIKNCSLSPHYLSGLTGHGSLSDGNESGKRLMQAKHVPATLCQWRRCSTNKNW